MEPNNPKRGRPREARLNDDEVKLIKDQMIEKCGSYVGFYELVWTQAKLPKYKNYDPPKTVETIDRAFDDAFSQDPERRRSLPKFYWKVLKELLGINRDSLPSQATATTPAPNSPNPAQKESELKPPPGLPGSGPNTTAGFDKPETNVGDQTPPPATIPPGTEPIKKRRKRAGALKGLGVLIILTEVLIWCLIHYPANNTSDWNDTSRWKSEWRTFDPYPGDHDTTNQQKVGRVFMMKVKAFYVPFANELVFTPSGTCKALCVKGADVTLELTYPTNTTTLNKFQGWWDARNPLKIPIPDGLRKVEKGRIICKYGKIFRFKPNVKDFRVPPDTAEDDFEANVDILQELQEYVIDLTIYP